MPKNK